MRLKVPLTLFFFAILVSCSHVQKATIAALGNPYEVDAEFVALGKASYELHCTQCHGATGLGDGPDLTSAMAAPPNFVDGSYEKSLGMIAANITHGKRSDMPAFKDQISEKEIWAVAHYVHSLNQKL